MNEDSELVPSAPKRFISRERLIEVAIIVFSVLLALGLESLVQEMRWRSEASELERLFAEDLATSLAVATERRAVDPCLRQQLQRLSTGVSNARGTFSATAYSTTLENGMAPVAAQAYRAPTRPWPTSSFDRALGTEAVKRIPNDRFLKYAQLFGVFNKLRELQEEERWATAELAPLAFDQPDFSAEVRADALKAIAAADAIRGNITLSSTQVIRSAQAFGLSPTRAYLERRSVGAGFDKRTLRQFLEIQRKGRGDCVDVEGSLRLLAQAK